MNIGQIFETVLGRAGKELGVKFATPIFDGASLDDLCTWTDKAGLPRFGKTYLFDGGTGEQFDQPATLFYSRIRRKARAKDKKQGSECVSLPCFFAEFPTLRKNGKPPGNQAVFGSDGGI